MPAHVPIKFVDVSGKNLITEIPASKIARSLACVDWILAFMRYILRIVSRAKFLSDVPRDE